MLHSSCCAHSHLLKDDLHDYTTRVKRTIREVLAEFRSLRIPREYVFDVFPLLRPREFSIASSSKVRVTHCSLVLHLAYMIEHLHLYSFIRSKCISVLQL